jgi:hypothetical protein
MAIGDQNDIKTRLISYLPRSWFDGDSNPVRDAVLSGLAAGHSFIYSLLAYVRLQTRIKTATEGFLDLISQDFFGGALPRQINESDARFLSRIIVNIFRERATRNGVIDVLEQLTGLAPKIIELLNPGDCGAYGAPNSGYGSAGAYGSMLLQYQAFVQAFRPSPSGIKNVAGYGFSGPSDSGISALLFNGMPVAPAPSAGSKTNADQSLSPASLLFDGAPVQDTYWTIGAYPPAPGGYGAGQIEYCTLDMIQGAVTDADIYAAIASVLPEGTIAWVNISNPP